MKKLLLAMSALAALSLLVPSTGVAQTAPGPNGWYNHIGVYTTQDANPANTSWTGAAGQITAYVVITNPRNYHFGDPNSSVEQNITVVGGFEFKIVVPAGTFLANAVLPPQTTNFASSPNFICGTNLPVTNGRATALTLTIVAFTATEGYIYLNGVDSAPSIPGKLALTDYNDAFRLNEAFPASGSYAAPVFGLWPAAAIVPAEDASWSDLKSMYR